MIFLTLTQRLKVEDWCLEEGHSTPVLERTKPFYPSCIIPSWAQLRGRVHPPDCRLSLWPLALAGAPACGIWVGEHWFQLKKISEILATTWQLSNQLGLSGLQPAAACSQLLTGIDGADGVNHHPRDFFFFFYVLHCLASIPWPTLFRWPLILRFHYLEGFPNGLQKTK